jgi:hypothetical protein
MTPAALPNTAPFNKDPASMSKLTRRGPAALLAASALAGLVPLGAHAQEAPISTAAAPAGSESAMANLVRALVKQGALNPDVGAALIKQAEAEARAAQMLRAPAPSAEVAALPGGGVPIAGVEGQHVQYVPQIVQDQMKAEVKQELTQEAERKGWTAPGALPEWVHRIAFGGDFRARGEGDFYSNANAGDFTNVNAINAGAPFNIDSQTNAFNPATLNSLKDRSFSNIRFRLTFDAFVAHDIDIHARLATGSDNQPVTTNQTLGNYFQKDAIWLDRAFVAWHPLDGLDVFAGRMKNPMRAADLIWDDDVNPDGIAASYERRFTERVSAYLTGAAYALSYIPANSPDTALSDDKTSSNHNRFIYLVQAGAAVRATDTLTARVNVDYTDYDKVQGTLSPPCLNTADFCPTDYTRPGYMQKGNTVFALRDLVALDPTNTASPQFFAVAARFQVLELSGDLAWAPRPDLTVDLSANLARNMAFSASDVLRRGFNANSGLSQIANNLACSADTTTTGGVCPSGNITYHSGADAYQVRLAVGTPQIRDLGDWSFSAMYKYIEPDALLDSFTDQDFHQGGTNAKGFVLIGTMGVRPNTNVSIRWFDTDQVFGPRYAVDVLQADLNVKF